MVERTTRRIIFTVRVTIGRAPSVVLAVAVFTSSVTVVADSGEAAAPLRFRLRSSVPRGEKPQIELTADVDVSDIRIALERGDKRKVALRHAALARGKSTLLAVGDGAVGKVSYRGTLSARVAGKTWQTELSFDTIVAEPIRVSYDAEHLDLAKGVLEFKVSRPITSASLAVLADDGKEVAKVDQRYGADTPQTGWLAIKWAPTAATVMKLQLRVAAEDGVATNVELIPWSVTVEHEDVNFATDSTTIEPSEAAKLDASVAKIDAIIKRSARFVSLKLYVAGHTDTVGSTPSNRKLSLARARAIATYFRGHGIALPIAYAGFGEEVLRVDTADNTDERANRRADYVIAPVGAPPPFRGPYLKARTAWQELR
jgi:outer membrane protein OmpA-like peptidoglycan-associated protein